MSVSIEVYALSNVLSRKEMKGAGHHPTAQGYAALAEEIAKRLKTTQQR